MPRGLGLIIYGIEGIGKTTFCLQAPKPLSIMPIREPGYFDLEDVGEVPQGVTPLIVKDYEDVKVAISACQAKTLVIDSISGLQEFLVKYITNTVYGGSFKAFKSFYNGLRQDCPREVAEIIDLLEFIRNKGTNVLICAHRQTATEDDPSGPDIRVQTLFGDIGVTGPFMKWAQATLFLAGKKQVDIVTKSVGFGGQSKVLEGKATAGVSRLMYTQFSGSHVAKNKLHLPPVIAMGKSAEESWSNFCKALPESIQKNLQS